MNNNNIDTPDIMKLCQDFIKFTYYEIPKMTELVEKLKFHADKPKEIPVIKTSNVFSVEEAQNRINESILKQTGIDHSQDEYKKFKSVLSGQRDYLKKTEVNIYQFMKHYLIPVIEDDFFIDDTDRKFKCRIELKGNGIVVTKSTLPSLI